MMKEFIKGISLGIGNAIPNASSLHRFRNPFYKIAGLKLGKNTTLVGPINFPVDGKGYVEIGNNTYINALTRFGPNGSGITIGNQCLIGPNVSFETGGHNVFYDEKLGRGYTSKKIEIEDRVWIGANVIVLQGVKIGYASVVAAGAVVTHDIPPNSIWAGVPAKEIRKIERNKSMQPITNAIND